MNYAGRFNSFVTKGQSVLDAIAAYKNTDGITHLEFNYPEHFTGQNMKELKDAIYPLKVNGVAVRWRNKWIAGNYTNPDSALREKAVDLAKQACDACLELGGSVVTLWFENDGFDYPFEMDYEAAWKELVAGIREVADYAPIVKISIEYKPYEERDFALVDSLGMTLFLVREVDRPNVGCTLDYCHMLMKHDSPAMGVALAASQGKLFGLHMNDGYGWKDSGLIFGSVSFAQSAEFIYYLERYGYDGVVFFDTFPIREDARAECRANLESFELIKSKVDRVGTDAITAVIAKRDGISADRLILELLK